MFKKVKVENLPVYVRKIESIFPKFKTPSAFKASDVSAYYKESFWGYALFHSWSGAIHMALSEGGRFSKNDYFRQAEEVEEILVALGDKTARVLEVGCGRGFNIAYLASKLPQIQFSGIDISKENVRSAKGRVSSLANASVELGDFHDLATFSDASFDLVFAVETLCHASDMSAALGSIGRVLADGGKFVVFDGFRNGELLGDDIVQRAVVYTEMAMAVRQFPSVDGFVNGAQEGGMALDYQQDRSAEIMPNLIRLSDLAKAFFKSQVVARVILLVLPRGLVTNAVAGLLMAVTVQIGAHQYIKLVFSKTA